MIATLNRAFLLAVSCLAMLVFFGAGQANAAAAPGKVEVDGLAWQGDPVEVDLNTLRGGSPVSAEGTVVKAFTLLEILQEADSRSAEVGLATLPKFEIAYPAGDGSRTLRYTGDEVRDSPGNQLARFFVGQDGWTNLLIPGRSAPVAFEQRNPKIFDPSKVQTLAVSLSPAHEEIESGDRVAFTATVSNDSGKAVEYDWAFGDGATTITDSGKISHVFRGKDKQFIVTVAVSSPGLRSAQDFSSITIGKVKKPKRKDKEPKPEDSTPDASSTTGGYGGYGSGGYGSEGSGGSGTGGSGSPSGGAAPSPGRSPAPEQKSVPVDDGLVEVSGQLVASASPAATMSAGEAVTEAVPETPGKSGALGVSTEAGMSLGLILLLGLGLLAERRGARL
ncbi:MAG: PKD domain-containing protein [Solirubrobacterales bacterium]